MYSSCRWDIPRYVIYRNGKQVDDMLDLDGFSYLWDDIVCFYTGCSFSFEHVLVENGIKLLNLQAGKNCSIYPTNIMLEDSGPFSGIKMVVSMRPIRKSLLETAVSVTAQFPHHHGAPIHIGNPARIGIPDVAKPDIGDSQVSVDDDSVFVFWACGVTNRMAIAAAGEFHILPVVILYRVFIFLEPSLAFSHFPGSMFIADAKPERKVLSEAIQVIELSRPNDPYFASIVGSKTANILGNFERSLLEDPGKRGIAHLFVKCDLLKSVLLLSHSKKVAITTGFPANVELPEKNETDGICGALSMCQALLALGKQVTLISDQSSESVLRSCVQKMVSLGALKIHVPVVSFKDAKDLVKGSQNDYPVYDCFVSIERCGRSADGTYRTMGKKDISALVDPIDDLFVYAASNPLVGTIGIGDGGNEIGMGKVKDEVVQNINYGDVIACQTSTDFLVSTGISDWGGYAISLGLYAVSQCPIHWRYVHQSINAENTLPFLPSQFLPSNEQVSIELNLT